MLGDLSTFFRSLSGMIDGFGERTRGVAELLRDPTTTFLIVTSPEPEPAQRGASSSPSGWPRRGMPRGALIVNRVHLDGLGDSSVEQVHAVLAPELGERLAERVAGNLADFDVLVRRDRDTVERLSRRARRARPDPRPAPRRRRPGPRRPGPSRRAPVRLRRHGVGSARRVHPIGSWHRSADCARLGQLRRLELGVLGLAGVRVARLARAARSPRALGVRARRASSSSASAARSGSRWPQMTSRSSARRWSATSSASAAGGAVARARCRRSRARSSAIACAMRSVSARAARAVAHSAARRPASRPLAGPSGSSSARSASRWSLSAS